MRRKNGEFDEVQDNGNGKEVQHLGEQSLVLVSAEVVATV